MNSKAIQLNAEKCQNNVSSEPNGHNEMKEKIYDLDRK